MARPTRTATATTREFSRIWKGMPKIVFSSSLDAVEGNAGSSEAATWRRSWLELREEFPGDLDIGGATLAASFIRRGLVDEFRLVVHPVVLGPARRSSRRSTNRSASDCTETHRFASGVVYQGYEAA